MRVIALSLAILAGSAPAFAVREGTVHLSPTVVTIRAGETTGSFVIQNEAPTPISFSVAAFVWKNTAAGEMDLQRTDDLIVYPTMIDVAAGQTRRVRIGTRVTAEAAERAYRITLEQTEAAAPNGPGIAMRLRFSMPIFVQPRKRTASVRLSGLDITNRQLRANLANIGALHVTPQRLTVTGRNAAGAAVWIKDLRAWYLLAGEARQYTAALTADECRGVTSLAAEAIFLEGAGLTVRTTETVKPGACGSS